MKTLLSLLLFFTPHLMASTHIHSSPYEIRILDAYWCGTCKLLKKNFKKNGITDHIMLNTDQGLKKFKIRWFKSTQLSRKEQEKLGFFGGFTPQFSFVNQGVLIKSQHIASDLRKFSLEELVPKAGESTTDYQLRFAEHKYFFADSIEKFQRLLDHSTNKNAKSLFRTKVSHQFSSFAPPQSNSVQIFATGKDASDNPLFSSMTVRDLHHTLAQEYNQNTPATLYGTGDGTQKDTVISSKRGKSFIASNVESQGVFNWANFSNLTQRVLSSKPHSLVQIFVGHGSQIEGLPLWGDGGSLTPKLLKTLLPPQRPNYIMINGACFSGQFASIPRCGFFAAPPSLTSSGCWEHSPGDRTDFLHIFFKERYDYNNDGLHTLREAYIATQLKGNSYDLPYTSTDHMADELINSSYPTPNFLSRSKFFYLLKHYGDALDQTLYDHLSKQQPVQFPLLVKTKKIQIKLEEANVNIPLYIGTRSRDYSSIVLKQEELQKVINNYSFADAKGNQIQNLSTTDTYMGFDKKHLDLLVLKGLPNTPQSRIWAIDYAISAEDYKTLVAFNNSSHKIRLLARKLILAEAIAKKKTLSKKFQQRYHDIQKCENQTFNDVFNKR